MNLKKIKVSSLFILLNIFVLFTSVLFIEEIYNWELLNPDKDLSKSDQIKNEGNR